MCLLSNRGCKYIRQDIRPKTGQRGSSFLSVFVFLADLYQLPLYCSQIEPRAKNKLDQTKCKVKFFFSPTSTSEFLGSSIPLSPPAKSVNEFPSSLQYIITYAVHFINKKESVIIKRAVFPGRLPGKVSGVGRTFFGHNLFILADSLVKAYLRFVTNWISSKTEMIIKKSQYMVLTVPCFLSHINKCTMHRALLFEPIVLRM